LVVETVFHTLSGAFSHQGGSVRTVDRANALAHLRNLGCVGDARLMSEKVKMRNGDAILVMVKDGRVVHFSWNLGLSHAEFVRRKAGTLPEGAWVGTVSKLDGEVMGITSKHFFNYQLPAPPDINDAIKAVFE
jgi:hypothetical protein